MAQPQATPQDRLERAKQALVIAESTDSRREAYKVAAEEIAAHINETGDTQDRVARYCNTSRERVSKLLAWRKADCPEGTTPFTMAEPNGSKPTDRAAVSHTKKVLRDAPMEQVETIMADLPPERRQAIRQAVDESHPAVQKKPPLGVPEPNVSFLTRAAGPKLALRAVARQIVELWELHAEGADPEDIDLVREDINDQVALISATITDWSMTP